jgi:hypothetical protein
MLAGDHPASGLVGLYATTSSSIVSAHFLGFIRPPFADASKRGVEVGEDGGLRLSFQVTSHPTKPIFLPIN